MTTVSLTRVQCGEDACFLADRQEATRFAKAAAAAKTLGQYDHACRQIDAIWNQAEAVRRYGEKAVEQAAILIAF